MRRRPLLVGAMLCALMALAPAASAQTELQPIERPEDGSIGHEAVIELVVDRGDFSIHWLDLQRLAARFDGRVVDADAGTREREGRLVSYGTADIRVPSQRFGDLVGELVSIGRFVDGTIESNEADESVIHLTLTESAGVTGSDPEAESMLGSAMETASRVVLTILSVIIVVAAALIPIGLLVAVGFAMWRWARRQIPPSLPTEDDVEPDPEPVSG